jgi:anti-sigma factor RsiW
VDKREELIRKLLDGELGAEAEAELRGAAGRDPALGAALERAQRLREAMHAYRGSLEDDAGSAWSAGRVDRIMRSLPEAAGRARGLPLLQRTIAVPAWAVLLLLVGIVAGAAAALLAPGPGPAPIVARAPASAPQAALCPSPPLLVRFYLRAPGAHRVSVAGDFNGWSVEKNPLNELDGAGVWAATVSLPQGRHPYKFFVDGEWVIDPEAELLSDGFGGKNSLLTL